MRSTKGEGSSIELWLPIAHEKAERAAANDAPDRTLEIPPLDILVVDDDELVLTNTVAMLEDLGHRVLEACCGQDALAVMSEHSQIDLVLTDYAMPRMNGLQLIRRVLERRPEISVVLATGYAEIPEGQAHDLCRLGKPFTQADLGRVIASAYRPAVKSDQ